MLAWGILEDVRSLLRRHRSPHAHGLPSLGAGSGSGRAAKKAVNFYKFLLGRRVGSFRPRVAISHYFNDLALGLTAGIDAAPVLP